MAKTKKHRFVSPIGECEYEYKNNVHQFSAKFGKDGVLFYGIPDNPQVSSILSTDDDIQNTCRGVMDMAAASMYDTSILYKMQAFRDSDVFIPTFVGTYHKCMLDDTPVGQDRVETTCGFFTTEGSKLFKSLISMFVDMGNMVGIVFPNCVASQDSNIS